MLRAAGGFIKTVLRVLRCVGHANSKLLIDKVIGRWQQSYSCT